MKKRNDLNRTFVRWLLSYVILSIVAIVVITYSASKYNQALRSEMEFSNGLRLELVQIQMDKNVRILRSFASKANLNKTVSKLRRAKTYDDVPGYELYELVRVLAEETMVESSNYPCYLYFPSLDFMVSSNYYNNSREFFDIALERYGFAYEDWYDVISKDYRTAQIFSLDTVNGKQLAVLIKPINISNTVSAVNAIMIVDLNDILKVSEWLDQDRDYVCVADEINGGIVSNREIEKDAEEELCKYLFDPSGQTSRRFHVGSSFVAASASQYEKWNYVVVTEEQPYVGRINDLQRIVVLLIALYLLVSFTAVGYALIHHYLPMKKVVDILGQEKNTEKPEGDAYEYVSRSVHRLIERDRKNTNIIIQQRNAIARELFHRLLTEKDASSMADMELLNQYGIQTGRQQDTCILVYKTAVEHEERDLVWFILKNVTTEVLEKQGYKSACFQENPDEQIYLIWTDGIGSMQKEHIEKVINEARDFIISHFKLSYHAAVSGFHRGIEELYFAYREAASVFEYQKQEEGRGVICYGDINLLSGDTLLTYPVEVENRLAHCIGVGDTEGACQAVRFLMEANQPNFLEPEVQQFLVSNIISSIMRVMSRIWKDEPKPVSFSKLVEVSRKGDYELTRMEIERVIEDVCINVLEHNACEQEKQKERTCYEAKTYVENHYSDSKLSVSSIAEYLEVHPNYLSTIFKDIEGEKLTQYIHKVRLRYVKEMLKHEEKLDDIAEKCGFGSPRTFFRIFKQYEGITPVQYKEMEEQREKGDA